MQVQVGEQGGGSSAAIQGVGNGRVVAARIPCPQRTTTETARGQTLGGERGGAGGERGGGN